MNLEYLHKFSEIDMPFGAGPNAKNYIMAF